MKEWYKEPFEVVLQLIQNFIMHQQLQPVIQQKLSEHFPGINKLDVQSIGGGSINDTYQLQFDNKKVFCKINSVSKFPQLFFKERAGLTLISQQNVIKTTQVIDCFETDQHQILLMEWIKEGERTEAFWKKFGEQLAALHKITGNNFGLYEDNYMGSVPQENKVQSDWIKFFIHQRLQPLIKRCNEKNLLASHHQKMFEQLFVKLPRFFEPAEAPSLLHGDLWSGNFMCSHSSEPVLIDPAVYFGHRSMDLAMTTLFGGFHKTFYEAYSSNFSFPNNYKEQWEICNLYPLLIHLYLFGRSYLPQIEQILKQLN
jgi:fructosamine-3-kinase